MHVLVGCNIENENNGCLGAPQTDLLFFPICLKGDAASKRTSKQGKGWVCAEMIIIPVLRFCYCYFFFFILCVGAF